MENLHSQGREPEIKLISSKKEISGESFRVRYPECFESFDVYRMGPLWYKLNSQRGGISEKIGTSDIEQINESFLSLVNKSDTVLVPTVKDGQDLANFYAEFANTYDNAYNLGLWSDAKETISKKTYAIGGYVDALSSSPNYFENIRQECRVGYLGEQKMGLNFFIISDIVKNSPVQDVVKHFAQYLDAQNNVRDSLSIYTNNNEEAIKLNRFIQDQSPLVRAGIKFNFPHDGSRDFVDKAVAVGDVYLGLSSYETYSTALYKSIYAGKGVVLPKSDATVELNSIGSQVCALFMNPHHVPTVINSMKKIANDGSLISNMMINNIKRRDHFSKSEYDKRVKMAVLAEIRSIHEI